MVDPGRRVHERFACDMAIWLKGFDDPEEFQLVEIHNIGAGGVLCLIHKPLAVDQQLDIRIELPQREEMVPVKGRIRHLRELGDQQFLVGIQFHEVEGMSVPAFMAYIEAMFL